MEYKTLNNGLKMPIIGLGVYNISERETSCNAPESCHLKKLLNKLSVCIHILDCYRMKTINYS